MQRKEKLWENELVTQNEVADYFRVVSGTVKNWREKGLLRYWQAPGSSKVLFYRDDILYFRDEYTFSNKSRNKKRAEIKDVKPSISSNKKDWRI